MFLTVIMQAAKNRACFQSSLGGQSSSAAETISPGPPGTIVQSWRWHYPDRFEAIPGGDGIVRTMAWRSSSLLGRS